MTEAEATTTMEETPMELSAEDVEMTNASEQPPLNEAVTPAPDSTPVVQNGAEQAEKNATPSEALPAEAPAKIEAFNPINGTAQTPATETNASSVENSAVMRDPTDPDVKMEDATEETSQVKRKDAAADETKADAEAAHENSDSSKEPAAKRLKVAAKPIDVPPPSSVTNATPTSTPIAASAVSAPLMMSRDDMAKMEEDTGLLKFDVITNDGTPEHMIQLTTLKNIFARQLPKMPREYIVRLVFDRNHRSMVILKNSKQVIGGICYRPFEPNHFAEIAFCAINAADQVKGYGTRLMNHLKEYVKASGITHFLTYADNYAIGYFKKQGFAKVVSMPRPNWFGYIKDYDGGTLMECTIHHQINYLRITSMVHAQRKVRRKMFHVAVVVCHRSHCCFVVLENPRQDQGAIACRHHIPGPHKVCRRKNDGSVHDPRRPYVIQSASWSVRVSVMRLTA
jgi:N-acetylglutamate synthase-like GNAT family acetyltransferase